MKLTDFVACAQNSCSVPEAAGTRAQGSLGKRFILFDVEIKGFSGACATRPIYSAEGNGDLRQRFIPFEVLYNLSPRCKLGTH